MNHGNVSPEIAQGLLALKARVDAAKIPPSKLDETANIAVWNIREFGKKKRTDAALHYISPRSSGSSTSWPWWSCATTWMISGW